jgi:MFS family permease
MLTCLLAAAASASVPLAQFLGLLTVPHLFAAALAAGVAMVFFDGAMFAALPAIVSRERLSQAFATMTATSTVIALLAPVAGGFLSAAITPEFTLLFDAALLSGATVVFALLREPERTRSAPDIGVWQSIREGLAFIVRTALVRSLTGLGIGNSIAEGLLSGLLVATVVSVYGMPDSGPEVGIAYSAIAVGALVGSTLLPRLQQRFAVRTITTGGLLVAAGGLALWSQQSVFVTGVVALMLYQLGATIVILNGITQRARVTPDALQGRVNTTARMFAWGGQPLGALAGAALVGTVGIPGTHLVGIALLAITALLALRLLRPASLGSGAAP